MSEEEQQQNDNFWNDRGFDEIIINSNEQRRIQITMENTVVIERPKRGIWKLYCIENAKLYCVDLNTRVPERVPHNSRGN